MLITFFNFKSKCTNFLKEQIFDMSSREMQGRLRRKLKKAIKYDPSEADVTKFNISVRSPSLLLLERLTDTVTSVLELDISGIDISQDKSTESTEDLIRLTNVSITDLAVSLKTVKLDKNPPKPVPKTPTGSILKRKDSAPGLTKAKSKNLKARIEGPQVQVISSLQVLRPVNFEISVKTKFQSVSGNQFLYIHAEADKLVTIISIQRFKTALGIIQNYIWKSYSSFNNSQADKNSKNTTTTTSTSTTSATTTTPTTTTSTATTTTSTISSLSSSLQSKNLQTPVKLSGIPPSVFTDTNRVMMSPRVNSRLDTPLSFDSSPKGSPRSSDSDASKPTLSTSGQIPKENSGTEAPPPPDTSFPEIKREAPLVDMSIDLFIQSFNITVVSDYEAELDLFYLYFKNIDSQLGIFKYVPCFFSHKFSYPFF